MLRCQPNTHMHMITEHKKIKTEIEVDVGSLSEIEGVIFLGQQVDGLLSVGSYLPANNDWANACHSGGWLWMAVNV